MTPEHIYLSTEPEKKRQWFFCVLPPSCRLIAAASHHATRIKYSGDILWIRTLWSFMPLSKSINLLARIKVSIVLLLTSDSIKLTVNNAFSCCLPADSDLSAADPSFRSRAEAREGDVLTLKGLQTWNGRLGLLGLGKPSSTKLMACT